HAARLVGGNASDRTIDPQHVSVDAATQLAGGGIAERGAAGARVQAADRLAQTDNVADQFENTGVLLDFDVTHVARVQQSMSHRKVSPVHQHHVPLDVV